MTTALRIITEDKAEDMILTWNSAAWFAKEETVRSADYFVCVKPKTREPFFIAKIERIQPVPESGPNRWALMFREYAEIGPSMIKILRHGQPEKSQNPLVRFELEEALNLAVNELPWKKVPTGRKPEWSFTRRIREGHAGAVRTKLQANAPGMSVAEAKRALAARFGVPEEAITITIQA